jgi:folate-binding protein YgfZ
MSSWTDSLRARGASFDGAVATAFGDLAAELAAARDGAVVCDLAPLAVLGVTGPDVVAFLQGQLTNDVEALPVGASHFSAWCSPKGRVLANFLVRRAAADAFELLLPASLAQPIRKRLGMFVLRSRVTIADLSESTVRLGVGGPGAAERLAAAFGPIPALHRSTTIGGGTLIALPGGRFIAFVAPEHAEDLWDRLSAHGARAAGFPCWQWLTVRTGVPVITPPTQDQFIPQMLNLDALDGINFRKGCYTGQEIVARTQYLGRLKERLVLAHVDGPPPRAGERIFATAFGDQPCGTVVNAAFAPGTGADLLAVVQNAAVAGGGLRLGATDGANASLLPLPYALPAPSAVRDRIA